jgi:hypothetical protein
MDPESDELRELSSDMKLFSRIFFERVLIHNAIHSSPILNLIDIMERDRSLISILTDRERRGCCCSCSGRGLEAPSECEGVAAV